MGNNAYHREDMKMGWLHFMSRDFEFKGASWDEYSSLVENELISNNLFIP